MTSPALTGSDGANAMSSTVGDQTPSPTTPSSPSNQKTDPPRTLAVDLSPSGGNDSRRRSGWKKDPDHDAASSRAGPLSTAADTGVHGIQLGPVLDPATINGESAQSDDKKEEDRAFTDKSKLESNDESAQTTTASTTTAEKHGESLNGRDTSTVSTQQPSTIRVVPQRYQDTDDVEMISPIPVRAQMPVQMGTSILNDSHVSERNRSRSGSTSTASSVILITTSPNPASSPHFPMRNHSSNSQTLGIPQPTPRFGLPQPVGSVPLSSPSQRSVSPNPSIRSQASGFAPISRVSSRRSSFSFSLSMGNGGRDKSPSPGPESAEGMAVNGGTGSKQQNHGRKSSISRTIAGALIPGWATGSNSYRDESKDKAGTTLTPGAGIKRGKSPSLSARKSMDWGSASDVSTIMGGSSRMTRFPSTSTVNTLATTNMDVGKPSSASNSSTGTVPPPPIATKPRWLRRGLGAFTSSSSSTTGLHGSSTHVGLPSSRDLKGVAEGDDEPPAYDVRRSEAGKTVMGPPSLPLRHKATVNSVEQKVPTLPPRKPASSSKNGTVPSGSTSANASSHGTSSRLSIASALDFRRPKSPGRLPLPTSPSLSVPEAGHATPDPATDPPRQSPGLLSEISKSFDEETLLSSSRGGAVPGDVNGPGQSKNSGNGLLPPPMPQRTAQSMDVPRRAASGSGYAGSAGSISGLNSLHGGTRTARTGANRKWTGTTNHAADLSGGPIPRSLEGVTFPTSSSSSSFLHAAPGAIGSAVSTGWAALRSTRSSLSFPHSSSNSAFPRSGSTNTSDSSWIRVDGNGHDTGITPSASSRTGLGYEGPKLAPKTILRRPRPGQEDAKLAFGKNLEEAVRACPIADLPDMETSDTECRRKKRMRCLPAVAVRCVDHLCIWAPQEEGIFRISGRSTHIAHLRKQFDAGADIVLELCDPGDVDPHAVASLYRSYLRELPLPILTDDVMPKFNRLIDGQSASTQATSSVTNNSRIDLLQAQKLRTEELPSQQKEQLIAGMAEVLDSLSDSSWWLLNDLSRILALTSQHSQINKMTIQNLLTVFSPSLKISMTFLKLLVEHHDSIFINEDKPATLADRGGNDKRLSLMPDILLTSDSTSPPLGESNKANTIEPPSTSDLHEDSTASNTLQPSPVSDKGRFSTPIADKFARTGPVIISFREPSPNIETNKNQ